MRHIAWVLVLTAAGSATPAAEKPNVVFILADDLGVNDLGCYGRKDHRTPNLDRLAQQGVRFTSAYAACPVCSPTRAAIMTGKHPARLHITTFLPGRGDFPSQKLLHPKIDLQLPLAEVTLAERMKAAGYATACIGKWHLGGAGFGPAIQGFDFVHAGRANTTPGDDEGGKGEYDLTRKAEEFLTANRDKPFILYLCHNSPHIPLGARKDLVEKYAKSFNPVYAAMIDRLDDAVGRVLKKLDDLKLADRTIVVFTSDNGGLHVPEMTEDPPTHNTPYRAGKGFLYEGGIRVPAIVRGPGTGTAGRTVDAPVISTDWTPTILDWCGVKTTDVFDGESITSVTAGGAARPRVLCWHIPHYTNQGSRPAGAMRVGKWKLIEHYEDGAVEVFDLDTDPGETKNVAADRPAFATGLQGDLAAWRTVVDAQGNAPNPKFDPALYRPLYVDTDVSKLKPSATAVATGAPLKEWRKQMDDVARKK